MSPGTRLGLGLLLPLLLGGCVSGMTREQPLPPSARQTPPPVEQLMKRGHEARDRGNSRGAISAFLEVPKQEPRHTEALLGVGDALLLEGKPGRAVPFYSQVLEERPDHPAAAEGRGLCHIRLDQAEAARADLQTAVKADPARWCAWNGLGVLATARGDYPDAIGYYNQALRLLPDSPILLNNYGYAQIQRRNLPEAEQALRRALAIAPGNTGLRNNLALALAWQGRYQEAFNTISSALPKATAYNNVGYVAMQRGELELARDYFTEALKASPTYHVQAARNLERLERLQTHPGD
ncbi:MAG: tetratricopeptide repeat protein [Candidatus Sedimenticola endophacoides]